MGRTFRGEYTFKVDTKGRMSIPALFRRVLEEGDPDFTTGLRPQLVIVYGAASQQHLDVYTVTEMDKLEAKIAQLPNSGLKRRLIRERVTKSHPTEVDPDGRLVLPKPLRDKIGLDREALFIGHSDTFQIWHPETYLATVEDDADEDLGFDLPPDVSALDALDRVLAGQGGG